MRVLRFVGFALLLLLVGAAAGFVARLVWPKPTSDYHPTYAVGRDEPTAAAAG